MISFSPAYERVLLNARRHTLLFFLESHLLMAFLSDPFLEAFSFVLREDPDS